MIRYETDEFPPAYPERREANLRAMSHNAVPKRQSLWLALNALLAITTMTGLSHNKRLQKDV